MGCQLLMRKMRAWGPESSPSVAPRSQLLLAGRVASGQAPVPHPPPANLPCGGRSLCDVPLLGPTGLPPGSGTPCCCITAASMRSTTSSPWRSWASRCSSPSQQVRPLPPKEGAAL